MSDIFWTKRAEGWTRVDGEVVDLSDIAPKFNFFVYEQPDEGWYVVEAKTGAAISDRVFYNHILDEGHEDREEAIAAARERIAEKGVARVAEVVKKMVRRKDGLSPAYRRLKEVTCG